MINVDDLITWLQKRKGEWPLIAQESGLNYWWIQRFAQGRIPKPGYDKINKLSQYIDSKVT